MAINFVRRGSLSGNWTWRLKFINVSSANPALEGKAQAYTDFLQINARWRK